MIARLGNVIFGLGVIVALVVIAFAIVVFLNSPPGSGDRSFALTIAPAFAAVSFGIGWAVRYILTGRRGVL